MRTDDPGPGGSALSEGLDSTLEEIMKQEKITDKTTLFSMEPTDAYGWGGCQLNPFKLETGFKSADGVVFVFYDLFAVRPDLIQVAAHEERAAARFDARERQRLGAG